MGTSGQPSLFELALDQESIGHLNETARWGKFLAIVGFVTCGLIVVGSLVVGALFATYSFPTFPTDNGVNSQFTRASQALGGVVIAGMYLVFAGLYFFPCLFLYHFSRRMKTALKDLDPVKLNQSLKAQKFLFRYVGIFTIVGIAIEAVALLIIGVVAAIAALAHH